MRILVLEDDFIVGYLLKSMLKNMDYHAVIARDGQEAIALFKASHALHAHFIGAILDYNVPGELNGKEVFDCLRAIDPDIPAIICSGATHDIMKNHARYGFVASLPKPYTFGCLKALCEKHFARLPMAAEIAASLTAADCPGGVGAWPFY